MLKPSKLSVVRHSWNFFHSGPLVREWLRGCLHREVEKNSPLNAGYFSEVPERNRNIKLQKLPRLLLQNCPVETGHKDGTAERYSYRERRRQRRFPWKPLRHLWTCTAVQLRLIQTTSMSRCPANQQPTGPPAVMHRPCPALCSVESGRIWSQGRAMAATFQIIQNCSV